MSRPSFFVAGALLIVACESRPRAPETASVYADTNDTASGTLLGIESQAKPLIPATRDMMRRLREQPAAQGRENLTAYKHQLGNLLNAMRADLERTGAGDIGAFRGLSDSVADDLGGGTGRATGLGGDGIDSAGLSRHLAQVDRLINSYEETMRRSATRSRR